jgi:hypothetical protein
MKPTIAADARRLRKRHAIENKLVALDQAFATGGNASRSLRRDGAAVVINHRKRLVDVQRPRLAAGVDAVPIEEPKCRIARLLDLGNEQARAQGVYGSSGNKDAVTRLRREGVQLLFQASLTDRRCDGLSRGAGD